MNRCKVQEIAELITKGTTPTTLGFSYIDEGINFVKIESIDANGKFDKTKFAHISEECHVSLKRSKLQKNDILFSIAGAIGRTAIVSEDILPANTNQALAIIRLKKNNNDLNFIRYQLSSASVIKQTEKQKQGVAQLNLSLKDIGNLEINVPSLPEQKKIASHLDTIQSAIDNKKQQLQQLDELVKSKFVEMFGENPVESGKWKVEKLDTLVQVTSSKRIYAEEQTDSGIPFLRISDLVSRINGLEQAELYISYEKYNEFGKKGWVPTKDDILVTTRGTLGLCYIIREDDEFYFQDGMITWLKFDNHEKVLSVFICYLFAYVLSPKFNIKSNGATVKYLSISDLKVEKIPVPPIELQNDFAAYVQKIDSAKSIIKTQLNDLNELLESKMDFYFGE